MAVTKGWLEVDPYVAADYWWFNGMQDRSRQGKDFERRSGLVHTIELT